MIYRSDDRTCANCNAPDWTGAPMPTPTETRPQVVDPGPHTRSCICLKA
ncbi:hypothetical protein [Hankyongella ginsenosidimutans]|nr:hypothetical protein [Hankyongella ginsenosidimutans]